MFLKKLPDKWDLYRQRFNRWLFKNYSNENVIETERVRFLFQLCLLVIAITPVVLFYTVYILHDTMTNINLIIVTETLCLLIEFTSLIVLLKGFRVLSAHLVLISIMFTSWLIFFLDDVGMPYQLDTIVFIIGVSTMVPFAVKDKGSIIWIYTLVNISILAFFVIMNKEELMTLLVTRQGALVSDGVVIEGQSIKRWEYFFDNMIAFIFIGYSSYNLYKISDKALKRSDADLRSKTFAEAEVRRLKEMMKDVIDSMPSAIIGVDRGGNIFQWNQGASDCLGISSEDAVGSPIAILQPVFGSRYEELESFLQAKTVNEIRSNQREGVDGKPIIEDCIIYPLQRSAGGGVVIRLDDVTEKKNMEEVLVQSEKMASLGSLAAGVAHEINNPLAGMLQNLQVMRNRLAFKSQKDYRVAEKINLNTVLVNRYLKEREINIMIESIMTTGQRAAQIVNGMLSFSKSSSGKMEFCDPIELLDSTIDLCRNEYQMNKGLDFRKIQIVREFQTPLVKVFCLKNKIQQVFFNILRNGAESMHERHLLNIDGMEPRFSLLIRQGKESIIFEITDNGKGINKEILDRIFDPFFSTKTGSTGTGLGLYISYLIITQEHFGTIEVDSEPNELTRFKISLPLKNEYAMFSEGEQNAVQ